MPSWLRPSRALGRLFGLACIVVGSASRPARAASTALQAIGETSVGVSDNLTAAPDVPLPGGTAKSAGAFVVLRPGLTLGVLSPSSVQRVTYTFDYDLYFARATSSSSSNRLEYHGFFDLLPSLDGTLGAALTESDSYGAFTLAPPASGLLPLLPGGSSKLFQAEADEQLNVRPSVGWRSWERTGVVVGLPLFGTEAPKTVSPNARLGLEYSWEGSALGAEGRTTYSLVRDGVRPDGTRIRLDRELTVGGVLLARHDLGRYFTSGLEAGAVRVSRLETGASHWYPLAAATLAYADFGGDATLGYAHGVTTNPLLGQALVFDEVRLRGGIPLDKKATFVLGTSTGYQRGRLLDDRAELAAHLSVLLADVTFGWKVEPWLLLGVRGQHVDQRSDVRVVSLPVSFVQNNVMLGAVIRFPPDAGVAAEHRAPVRVDRSDELVGVPRPANENIPAPSGRAR